MLGVRDFDVYKILSGVAEGIADGANLVMRKALVLASPKQQNGAAEIFRAHEQARVGAPRRDAAAVIRGSAADRQRQPGEKRGAASHAVADGADAPFRDALRGQPFE